MIVVGKSDAFERKYRENFRVFASQFGEFVTYERDRGARDIGLHLTQKRKSGMERLSTALCWFQLKGIMDSTLPAKDLNESSEIKISLNVEHLRYWYLQAMPTYLVVYLESVDEFLILNIQKHVTEKWGKNILTLRQKTATISIPRASQLDDQAFHLIMIKNNVEEWKKALEGEEEDIRVCVRDYDLIWHLGTAEARNVEHQVRFWDWQTKTRSQLYIEERPRASSDEWQVLREHWEYMMNIFDLEPGYPYIEFYAIEFVDDDSWYDDGYEYYEAPELTLSNGDVVNGEDYAGEYYEYRMGIRLNEIGEEMFCWVENLLQIGLIEIGQGKNRFISVAPWHGREV